LGESTTGFIGENSRKAKGLKFFFSPLARGFFILLSWGFNKYKEWIIQLN
jgi:hypothetical protein